MIRKVSSTGWIPFSKNRDTVPVKVLVVDDNPDVLTSIDYTLKPLGYEILKASSGKECLDILKTQTVDVILLDIMMPEEDGWQVASKIREHAQWRSLPIIFVTAKADDMSISLGSLCSEEYLIKPFEPHDLIRAIQRIVSKR